MKCEPLCDFTDPVVKETAGRLASGAAGNDEIIERLFYYVRDNIRFGFSSEGDFLKASAIIEGGMGQCNNKSVLFLALCKALGIEAKIHFSLIKREIQRGLFRGFMFTLMPENISHSWVDVLTNGGWIALDAYINDIQYYSAARQALKRENLDIGYSVACSGGKSGAEFSKDNAHFVQMAAVIEDHGVFDEPADYYNSKNYRNRPGFLKNIIYRIYIKTVNRRIDNLRQTCAGGLCGT